jgi:hypothetical protein
VPLTAYLETLPQISVSPSIAFVVALAAMGVCAVRVRFWRDAFTLFDAGAILCAMTAGSMALVPLIETSREDAKAVTLVEDLRILRSQIDLYKLQHGGRPPLLYKGTFPQLISSTNGVGVPGNYSRKFPFGPYLPRIPANPVTVRGARMAVSPGERPDFRGPAGIPAAVRLALLKPEAQAKEARINPSLALQASMRP